MYMWDIFGGVNEYTEEDIHVLTNKDHMDGMHTYPDCLKEKFVGEENSTCQAETDFFGRICETEIINKDAVIILL